MRATLAIRRAGITLKYFASTLEFDVPRQPHLELLEPRILYSAIAWTGNGDGMRWADPANWSGNAVPSLNDDVTIQGNASNPIEVDSGNNAASSITSSRLLVISGGSLRVLHTAQLDGGLTVSGGKLIGGTWSGSAPFNFDNSDQIDRVTLNENVTLAPTAFVQVVNGLTLNGTMTLQTSGNILTDSGSHAADIEFLGSQSLLGTGIVTLTDNLALQAHPDIVYSGQPFQAVYPDQQPNIGTGWSSSLDVVDVGDTTSANFYIDPIPLPGSVTAVIPHIGTSPATLTIGQGIVLQGGGLIGSRSSVDASIISNGIIQPDYANGFTSFIALTNNGLIDVKDITSSFNFTTYFTNPRDDDWMGVLGDPNNPGVNVPPPPLMLVNNGTLIMHGYMDLNTAGWRNTGQIESSNGVLMDMGPGINSGSISATNGYFAFGLGNWVQGDFSPGSFDVNGGQFELVANGLRTADTISRVNISGNVRVDLEGTFDNSNSTINVSGSQYQFALEDASIDGGTINVSNGGHLSLDATQINLTNVTLDLSNNGSLYFAFIPQDPTFDLRTAGYPYLTNTTLDIADAADSTLLQGYYDSPTGRVSIVDQIQWTGLPTAPPVVTPPAPTQSDPPPATPIVPSPTNDVPPPTPVAAPPTATPPPTAAAPISPFRTSNDHPSSITAQQTPPDQLTTYAQPYRIFSQADSSDQSLLKFTFADGAIDILDSVGVRA